MMKTIKNFLIAPAMIAALFLISCDKDAVDDAFTISRATVNGQQYKDKLGLESVFMQSRFWLPFQGKGMVIDENAVCYLQFVLKADKDDANYYYLLFGLSLPEGTTEPSLNTAYSLVYDPDLDESTSTHIEDDTAEERVSPFLRHLKKQRPACAALLELPEHNYWENSLNSVRGTLRFTSRSQQEIKNSKGKYRVTYQGEYEIESVGGERPVAINGQFKVGLWSYLDEKID